MECSSSPSILANLNRVMGSDLMNVNTYPGKSAGSRLQYEARQITMRSVLRASLNGRYGAKTEVRDVAQLG